MMQMRRHNIRLFLAWILVVTLAPALVVPAGWAGPLDYPLNQQQTQQTLRDLWDWNLDLRFLTEEAQRVLKMETPAPASAKAPSPAPVAPETTQEGAQPADPTPTPAQTVAVNEPAPAVLAPYGFNPDHVWGVKPWFHNMKPLDFFSFHQLWDQLRPKDLFLSALTLGYLLNHAHQYNAAVQQSTSDDFWKKISPKATYMGDGMFTGAVALGLWLTGTPKNREVAQMAVESALYSGVQVQLLKSIFGIRRPSDDPSTHLGLRPGFDAFPGGHSTTAWSLATIIGENYHLTWLTYPLAFLTSITRQHLKAHWAADDFAGAILGHMAAWDILDRHGVLTPQRYADNHQWGILKFSVDGSLEKTTDSNVFFSAGPMSSDRFGRLELRINGAVPLGQEGLLQGAFWYARQTYDSQQQLSFDDRFLALRADRSLGPRWAGHVGYRSHSLLYYDIGNFPALNLLSLENVRDATYQGGVSYKLSPRVVGSLDMIWQNREFPRFEGLNGTARIQQLSLTTVGDRPKQGNYQVLLQRETMPAQTAFFGYTGTQWATRYTQPLGTWDSLGFSYQSQAKQFVAGAPGGGARKDNFRSTGIQYQHNFRGWDLRLNYQADRAASNDPAWSYGKNLFTLGVDTKF